MRKVAFVALLALTVAPASAQERQAPEQNQPRERRVCSTVDETGGILGAPRRCRIIRTGRQQPQPQQQQSSPGTNAPAAQGSGTNGGN